MTFFRAIDSVMWSDRFEPFRTLVAWGVVLLAVGWFGSRLVVSTVAAVAR